MLLWRPTCLFQHGFLPFSKLQFSTLLGVHPCLTFPVFHLVPPKGRSAAMLFLGSLQSPPLRPGPGEPRWEVPYGWWKPVGNPTWQQQTLLTPRFKDEHLPAKVEIRNVRLPRRVWMEELKGESSWNLKNYYQVSSDLIWKNILRYTFVTACCLSNFYLDICW